MPRRVSSSAALRADHPRWLFKDAANPLSALNRLLFPHLRWRHGLGRRQRVLSAPTDQLSLLLGQGRIGRPCGIGLARSGYRTFDALRFWSLWPPRFASARKSRWGSKVSRGVVGHRPLTRVLTNEQHITAVSFDLSQHGGIVVADGGLEFARFEFNARWWRPRAKPRSR